MTSRPPDTRQSTSPTGVDLQSARAELGSLRQEILVRVVFQNVLLCLAWIAFGGSLAGAMISGRSDALVIYSPLALAASAMWAHHGARTVQIRAYLQSTLEPAVHESSSEGGWEHALGGMRFHSLLGSRWRVSTKGFLLGSQALLAALLLAFDATAWAVLACVLCLAGTAWVLHEPPLDVNARG